VIFARRLHSEGAGSSKEIAAAWALEEQYGLSARRQAKRDVWLAASPENPELLRAAKSALGLLDRHAGQAEILSLRQAALGARPEQESFRGRVFAAAVGGVLAASGVFWVLYGRTGTPQPLPTLTEPALTTLEARSTPARYATSIGERSTIPLADGSTIVLNTASTVEVLYTPGERHVRLLHGQALFTVAHGQPAPFRVYAGDRVITALGTIFDVRLEGPRVEVGMLEGTVRVGRGREAGETLSAGEALVAEPAEPARIKTADVERMTSWRSGLLMFNDTSLAAAIAEVNRYTSNPLTLTGAAAADYRVTGTFRVGEPERFARTMTELFALELGHSEDGRIVLKKRPTVTPDR
jgi:transmembrane sensor